MTLADKIAALRRQQRALASLAADDARFIEPLDNLTSKLQSLEKAAKPQRAID